MKFPMPTRHDVLIEYFPSPPDSNIPHSSKTIDGTLINADQDNIIILPKNAGLCDCLVIPWDCLVHLMVIKP
jgi:hypothetical protein